MNKKKEQPHSFNFALLVILKSNSLELFENLKESLDEVVIVGAQYLIQKRR